MKFPYDTNIIPSLKAIAGHRWHPSEKYCLPAVRPDRLRQAGSFRQNENILTKLTKIFENTKLEIDLSLKDEIPNKTNKIQSDDLDAFRKELRLQNCSHKTIKAYLSCLRSAVAYFRPRHPKELAVRPMDNGYIRQPLSWVVDGNTTCSVTLVELREVWLKSRMREICTSGSVRGLIVAPEEMNYFRRRWL